MAKCYYCGAKTYSGLLYSFFQTYIFIIAMFFVLLTSGEYMKGLFLLMVGVPLSSFIALIIPNENICKDCMKEKLRAEKEKRAFRKNKEMNEEKKRHDLVKANRKKYFYNKLFKED
jgi:hypothetical protein